MGNQMKVVDQSIVGNQYGCFTVMDKFVIRQTQGGARRTYWLCRCRCGDEEYIEVSRLKKSHKQYCSKCKPIARRRDRLYMIYHAMKQRCYTVRCPTYARYGANGIRICDEWLESYEHFESWAISHGYKDNLTIDRIDARKGYAPENCQWISLSENSRRANIGRHKNKSRVQNMYAISPEGLRCNIDNITRFAHTYHMPVSTVCAIVHGRLGMAPVYYKGREFHSDLIDS